MELSGIAYRWVVASHVTTGSDGLVLECWREETVVFEVFRNDESLQFEVTLFEARVPLELLATALERAPHVLGSFDPLQQSRESIASKKR